MVGKVIAILLSFLLVWYAADRYKESKTSVRMSGISVMNGLADTGTQVQQGEGVITVTAAMRTEPDANAKVRFVIEGESESYERTVELDGKCRFSNGYYCKAVSLNDLPYGSYTVYAEAVEGLHHEKLLVEKGTTAVYSVEADRSYLELSETGDKGSVWFVFTQKEVV